MKVKQKEKKQKKKKMGVDISGGGVCDIPAIDLHGHQSAVVSNGLFPRSSLVPHVKVAGRHGFGARAGKQSCRQLVEVMMHTSTFRCPS